MSALQTEELLDKLSVSLTGEELDIIEKLYHQAMKLEIEFFSAQSLVQPTVVPLIKEHNSTKDRLMIFSDFDLTCTVVDSSAILAEIAIVTAPKSDQSQSEDQIPRMSSADLRNTWGHLSKQYTEEYEQCIESITPPKKGTDKFLFNTYEFSTLCFGSVKLLENHFDGGYLLKIDRFPFVWYAAEFVYNNLHKALEQLSEFENKANNRVIESGVLKGLNIEDIKRAGERLILQDGCIDFFKKIVKSENLNANVHVLSYCWCGDLIRSAFSSGTHLF